MELVKSKSQKDGKEYYSFRIEASVMDSSVELISNLEDVFLNDDKDQIEATFHDLMIELVDCSERCESCGYEGVLKAGGSSLEDDEICECSIR